MKSSAIPVMVALTMVFYLAALFSQSNDWRDRLLGWIVMIVYVLVVSRKVYLFAKRRV